MKNLKTKAALIGATVVSTSAFADVSASIAAMQTQMTEDTTTLGTALIAVAAVAVGFKWLKAMLFGG